MTIARAAKTIVIQFILEPMSLCVKRFLSGNETPANPRTLRCVRRLFLTARPTCSRECA